MIGFRKIENEIRVLRLMNLPGDLQQRIQWLRQHMSTLTVQQNQQCHQTI